MLSYAVQNQNCLYRIILLEVCGNQKEHIELYIYIDIFDEKTKRDQHSALVSHWLCVPGDHCQNPGWKETNFLLSSMSCDLMIAVYF